jgi:hypothetical protein
MIDDTKDKVRSRSHLAKMMIQEEPAVGNGGRRGRGRATGKDRLNCRGERRRAEALTEDSDIDKRGC